MLWRSLILSVLMSSSLGAAVGAQPSAQLEEFPTAEETPSPVFEPPTLRLKNSDVKQGQPLLVTFQPGSVPNDAFTVEVAGQKVPMYRSKRVYHCFIAIPADQKPGGYTLRVKDSNGQEQAQQKIEVYPGSFYTQHIRFYRPKQSPEQQKIIDAENAKVDAASEVRSSTRFFQKGFIKPVPHRISSVYGTRRYLNGKYNGYHSGVDFASPMGYPVKAPAGAKVTLAQYFSKWNANGNTVFLDHGLGVTSVYIHLSKIAVKEGDIVKQGDTIAYIGSTGRSTGPHLHWGLYLNGTNTDGLNWIEYSQALFREGLPF